MTNGEKIKAILKPRTNQIRVYGDWVEIEIQSLAINFSCGLDWWNAEYKEPTTKNDLGVDCISREFQEIVVKYPPEDLCIYPEYKGKPYFSIKYKEGNDYIIGYGTYNPKVFSKYLRDYFLPSVTPQKSILDKLRNELHATAEIHEDGDYYLRDEWIDEYFDEYMAESEET